MLRAVLVAGLLPLAAAHAEPRPFPPGLQAAWILEGSARLRVDGRPEPDGHLTVLSGGVYFTDVGYEALSKTTADLQVQLTALEARVKDYDAQQVAPFPRVAAAESGWSTNVLLGVFLVGLTVGLVGGTFVVARAAR